MAGLKGLAYFNLEHIPTMPQFAMESSPLSPLSNWDAVDTLLLDMDGTLLDLNFDNYFWKIHVPTRYAEANRINFKQASDLIYPHMLAIKGTLNWYSIHYWSDYLELDIVALKNEMAHLIQPRPGALEFLEVMRHHQKRLILTTNAHPDTLVIKFSQVRFEHYFHHVITSHQLGAPKETCEFWQRLHENIAFDPNRSLLIDDHAGVLSAAQKFGIENLMTIHQPDLQQPAQGNNGFYPIEHFNQIMPGNL
jgi:putative hydrolase of the HAD superfamily